MVQRIFSSDLNGTLVHQHTMSDMIRLYLGQEKFEAAQEKFKGQTAGIVSMQEAFANAGPLTKGLTLRQAIDYVEDHMQFVDGFQEFVDTLHDKEIPFIINSTGYGVTIAAIKAHVGADKVHGSIGNELVFGYEGDANRAIAPQHLDNMVQLYVSNPSARDNPLYDSIQATGKVQLGIQNEQAKADLLVAYAQEHFPEVETAQMIHMGDTMGDSGGIYGVAALGGQGIAFNYNGALEGFLNGKIAQDNTLEPRIHFVDPKSKESNLTRVLYVLDK